MLHYSRFRCAWDWLILVLTYYTAVMVPYNAAFDGKTVDDVGQLAADSVVDVIFFVDVLLNYHTSFVATSGDVTRSPEPLGFPGDVTESRRRHAEFPVTSQHTFGESFFPTPTGSRGHSTLVTSVRIKVHVTSRDQQPHV